MTLKLSPEVCAAAIVAAARSYGDDPILAVTTPRKRGQIGRRSLAPAALAIVQATGCNRRKLCDLLAVDYFTLSTVGHAPRAAEAHAAALIAMGVSPEDIASGRFPAKPPSRATRMSSDGPAKAVPSTPALPAPASAKPKVDHLAAIRTAMARRAQLPKPAPRPADSCAWPHNVPGKEADPVCAETRVRGRLFCADHCLAIGQKATPVDLAPPVMPSTYRDPRADNPIGRKAAS